MSKKSKNKKRQAQTVSGNPTATTGNKPAPQNNAPQNSAPQKAAPAKTGGNARTNKTAEPTGFFQRLLGVIMLRAPIYRELAHDSKGTLQAAIVVVVVALVVGAVNYFASTQLPGLPDQATAASKPVARSVVMVIQELLLWGAGAFVIAAVAKNMFQGKTDTGEMLRVFGFTRVFQILLILGVFSSTLAAIVSIAGLALSIAGSIIGIREATGFTTGKAAIVGIFAIVLVAIIITFFTAFVLNPLVTTLLPT